MISVLIAVLVLAALALAPWLSQLGGGVDVELWERGRKALRAVMTGEEEGAEADAGDGRIEPTGNVRILPTKKQDDRIEEIEDDDEDVMMEPPTAHTA